jgi:hypothetical protein
MRTVYKLCPTPSTVGVNLLYRSCCICLLYLLLAFVCVDDCRGQKRVTGVITTYIGDITESGTIIMTSFDYCQLCISFT